MSPLVVCKHGKENLVIDGFLLYAGIVPSMQADRDQDCYHL